MQALAWLVAMAVAMGPLRGALASVPVDNRTLPPFDLFGYTIITTGPQSQRNFALSCFMVDVTHRLEVGAGGDGEYNIVFTLPQSDGSNPVLPKEVYFPLYINYYGDTGYINDFFLSAALMTGDFAIHFSWEEGILFPVYFLLGFLLYSSLFAGLAATCETEQELQMYMPLAAAPTWLSFAMIMLIINDSNSIWSMLASFFPPTAPIVMFLRMASEVPPLWQFAVSIGLMLLTIWGTLWFSSRLYRVGILMYGKRATLPELLKWLRYS